MKTNMQNGWSLFSEVALAPIYFARSADNYATNDNPQPASSISITEANATNRTITIHTNFAGPPYPDDHSIIFIYQVTPARKRSLSKTRFTFSIGSKQLHNGGPLIEDDTFPAAFPFNTGDQVICLIRQHLALNGTTNTLATATAT